MTRHVATRREDYVADAVGCVRVFASVFVVTGLFALSAAVLGAGGLDAAGAWPRGAVALIGAGHLGGGLFLWAGRWSGAVVRRRGVEWAERGLFRPARRRTIAPSEVARVEVEESRDSDGDAVFRVVLLLRSGERLPLTRQFAPFRERCHETAAAVAERLGLAVGATAPPRPATRRDHRQTST